MRGNSSSLHRRSLSEPASYRLPWAPWACCPLQSRLRIRASPPRPPRAKSTLSSCISSRRIRAHTPYHYPLTQADQKRFAKSVRICGDLHRQKRAIRARFTTRNTTSTLNQYTMSRVFEQIHKRSAFFLAIFSLIAWSTPAQAPAEKPKEKPAASSKEKTAEQPNAAQIELLESKYRFELNGDSRKEVHALVKINSELGVRQFARLNFDYNRSFQSVEIPLVHITHANGGTSDILPSAITDAPNPAVEKFPAYHDVRVKSVRILGLQPGDSLEYRVITTTTKPPLAPDFWLSHSFDRTGVVQTEDFILDLPVGAVVSINPETPASFVEKSGEGEAVRSTFHWHRAHETDSPSAPENDQVKADIAVSTLDDYRKLADKLAKLLYPREEPSAQIRAKRDEIFAQEKEPEERIKVIYDFVSKKVATVDLPLGSTGFHARKPDEILSSGYATPEDKATLFAALAWAITVEPYLYFTFVEGELLPVTLP